MRFRILKGAFSVLRFNFFCGFFHLVQSSWWRMCLTLGLQRRLGFGVVPWVLRGVSVARGRSARHAGVGSWAFGVSDRFGDLGVIDRGSRSVSEMSRLEKRKESKKRKRKLQRVQAALLSAEHEEVEPDEEAVIRQEQEEKEALAKEQAEHEEQERLWLLREEEARIEWIRKQEEEEAERKRNEEDRGLRSEGGEDDLEEGWEYVEDGPAEIIWQGNEIIVKKSRKKVRKGTYSGAPLAIEDKKIDGPISNPLPPQNVAFSSYQADTQDADLSANFGTEKDQTNCPFYIKTGVCRFGVRCKRLHPVFNEACTLLMRSMYTGAGLALEPVESLEYTDEEVVQDYEEFYDDVHSEFIQFGEIVNFKVCRNSSPHLRGNVYVHYVSQESAMAAYNHMNGRFYAKKQISCEFVGVHKWKLAICGEFMRTYYKTCSRGTACSFLHCFENPNREYEWADTDRPPPRFWKRKMAKLFGYAHVSDEEVDERSRTLRESNHDTDHRERHRDDRELVYDKDRKRDRRMRDSVREDNQRSGRGDRERKYYYEDETKDRKRRGSSKYNDRHRERHSTDKSYDGQREKHERNSIRDDDSASHSKEKSYDNRREKSERDTIYDGDSARFAMHGGEPGCINDERWIAGDEDPETDHLIYPRSRRRERRHRSTANDEQDDDHDAGHPGRNSPTPDRVGHHRSQRHRPRSSRSPSSHKARKSRSQDRSTSRRGRSQDGHYSSGEEQEDKHIKQARHRTQRASKEGKRTRHGTGHDIHNIQLTSDMPGRRGDEVVGKSFSSEDHPVSEHHQKVSKIVNIRSTGVADAVAGMVKDGNASGSDHVKLEIQSGVLDVGNQNQDTNSSSSTGTVLSLDLSADQVQRSTSEWQSWRKTKKVKLGLKERPMRVII